VKLQLPGRRCAINALAQTHEYDAKRLEFLDEDNEMTKISLEAVQSPADQRRCRS